MSLLSGEDIALARRRFVLDQSDAEYVEYAEAMARIGRRRCWLRRRRRFLQSRGYDTSMQEWVTPPIE
ncbi:hypothetical protein PSA01_54590 [Pseudonocardia saturnea]|uniref:Uncharacterized protein n=1 Tax=Pseudonocardia saturnea TaxID=33909 RepID=A0ABQ0S683_9PSEU|nr:hypothetical protein Pdca_15980 [Pseudonocardia autotrophica]GEC28430.1 hypothetical protein PSA01_54590 [Pseudonocardia saturnea]